MRHRAGQGRAGQGRAGQGRAGQGRAGNVHGAKGRQGWSQSVLMRQGSPMGDATGKDSHWSDGQCSKLYAAAMPCY